MKTFRIRTLAIVFIAALCMSGCANPNAYLADRVQDAGDTFTATVGVGAGAAAKVGPLGTGLLANKDMAGLRVGTLFYDPEDSTQKDYPFFGETIFWTSRNTVGRNPKFDDVRYAIIGLSSAGASQWFQIEAVAGIGPSVRLGFNPAEVVDFALGWLGIDIFGDDVNYKALHGKQQSSRQISYLSAGNLK